MKPNKSKKISNVIHSTALLRFGMETKEKTVNFGIGLPSSVHKQLVMQALQADMSFQDFMRSFITDGLSTLPVLEIDVKQARKVSRQERMAGR